MIKKYLSRFHFAINGILHALKNDFGFRTQIYLGLAIAFIVSAFLLPLTQTEVLFIVLGYLLILITELQNSALESALDKIHPELHNNIKHSKDMAAGAVLLAAMFLFLVLMLVVYNHF